MDFSFKQLIIAGGPVLFILLGLSVYSIAIIWERWTAYKKSFRGMEPFLRRVRAAIKNNESRNAVEICERHPEIYSQILLQVLTNYGTAFEKRELAEKAIEWHASNLSRNLTTIATIASISPFIGLFGTVIGVVRAFVDLSRYSGAGPSVVAMGIAEALVNTAGGLFVAIPAIIAYNYFANRLNKFSSEMNWVTEEAISKMHTGEFH